MNTRTHPRPFVAALLLLTAANATLAAVPASQTAPAPRPLEPREVVEQFMVGIIKADDRAVFAVLDFASDDVRKEAEAVLGEAIAQQQLDTALVMAFPRANPGMPEAADLNALRIEEVHKHLAAAQVAQQEDTAELPLDTHSSIYLIRKAGVWKVDFDKTQRANEGPANRDAVAMAAARTGVYRDVLTMVRTGKFSSAKQVNEEVQRRIENLPRPKPAAATQNAANPQDTAQRKKALADLATLRTALDFYEVDNGRFPTQAEGLAILTKPWPGGPKPLAALPKDPWGHDYVYRVSGPANRQEIQLLSAGPDGQPNTPDDVLPTSRP